MKTISKALFTVVLASGTLAANVSAANDQEREQCKAQVAQYYGSTGEMHYVGERRYRDGIEMKFAVRNEDASTGYTTTRLANCWLGAENYQAYTEKSDDTMVAEINGNNASPLEDALPR